MKFSNEFKANKNIKAIEINSSLLARNTFLNFIGQILPLIIGAVTIPFVIRGLGTDRFGLLSLVWLVLGYFTVFDFGLGKATTKFVSEVLGKGDQENINYVVWTAVTFQTLLGIVGAIFLVIITPLLVIRVLNIPQELIIEAKATFYLIAISLPIVLTSSSFRGVLAAAQRFDLLNAVKIPTSCATYLFPLVGLAVGFNLPGIVVLILLARAGALVVYISLNFRELPRIKKYSGSFAILPRLFSFGTWIMITNFVSPILVYFERFLIGSLLSMAALTFYSAPYEMVTRLTIIPTSLTMTLFPAFSAFEAVKNRQRLTAYFLYSIKYILLTLGPIILVINLFAEDILRLWLGTDFAKESTVVLQLLALGVLINSLAYTPFSLLQGVGRPDLPAKFHLLEMPFYIATAWILVNKQGIIGAAMAWVIRVTLDAILLFIAAFKSYKIPAILLYKKGLPNVGTALCMLTGSAYLLRFLGKPLPMFIQMLLFIVLFCLFTWLAWSLVLDVPDRSAILSLAKRLQK